MRGPPEPSIDPTAVNAVKQLEQDTGDAMVRVDVDKLNQIYPDDFATVGASGPRFTDRCGREKSTLRGIGQRKASMPSLRFHTDSTRCRSA